MRAHLDRPVKITLLILLGLTLGLVMQPGISAQSEEYVVPEEVSTPRASYETFLDGKNRMERGWSGGLEKALMCFDFTDVPETVREQYSEEVVWKLIGILNVVTAVDASELADTEDGNISEENPDDPENPIVTTPSTVIYTDLNGTIEFTHDIFAGWVIDADEVLKVYLGMEISSEFELEELPEVVSPVEIPQQLSSPMSCYETYAAAMVEVEEGSPGALQNAAVSFDLNNVADEDRETQGADAARQLGKILETLPQPGEGTISDDLSGPAHVFLTHEKGVVEIGMSEDGAWRYTPGTVIDIPKIYFAMVDTGEIQIVDIVETSGEVPQELATPRSCYVSYTNSMKEWNSGENSSLADAVETLDLSDVSAGIVNEHGPDIAKKLGEILDNVHPKIDPETLPHETVAADVTVFEHGSGSIVLAKSDDGAWRFSTRTVAEIPAIYRAMMSADELDNLTSRSEYSGMVEDTGFGIASLFPESWRNSSSWQIIYLIIIVLIGLILDFIIPILLRNVLKIWFRFTILKDRYELVKSTSRPFGFLAMSAFWWIVLGGSGLDVNILLVLLVAVKFMTAFGIVWCAYRAVDVVSALIEDRAAETRSKLDDLLAPFIRKLLKVLVTIFGIVFIISNFGVNMSSMLAGLGIGGIAVALAAKDTLENLFGSITILFDRPFQIGDWVVIDGEEGTVEELGFRSTRIRTFYNSVIIVPNAKLVNAYVDNYGERQFRRIKTTIGVTYDTPADTLEAFCEGIRELIREHPYTRKDYFHVYFNNFGASSLDIMLYAFFKTPEWATELRERHRLLMDILRLGQELGIEFAFPTQTIHMGEEKPGQPIFPEEGMIRGRVDEKKLDAKKRAREISSSSLGGRGVVPSPVDAGDKWADDGMGDGDG